MDEDVEKIGVAKFKFDSQEETEMSLGKGDEVVIVEDVGDGWSFCYLRTDPDQNGYVPTGYLNIREEKIDKSLVDLRTENNTPKPSGNSDVENIRTEATPSLSSMREISNQNQLIEVSSSSVINEKRKIKQIFLDKKDTVEKINQSLHRYRFYLKYRRYAKSKKFKDQMKRLYNIRETVSTEETYLKQLRFCVENLRGPMQEQKIIKADSDFKGLFSDIQQITMIAQNLLTMLKESEQIFPKQIAPCFKRISPFFKMYRNYVNNYDESMKILEKCRKKNAKFVTFCENTSRNTPKYCYNYKIEDFLILPIQRIPRYRMLLANIMKLTHHEHNEYAELKDALRIVEEVANFVNRAKKQKILQRTTIAINDFLKGRYDNFLQAHRHLIKFMKVKIQCTDLGYPSKKFIPFFGYLFSDLILLVKVGENLYKKKNIDYADLKKKGISKDRVHILFLVTMEVSDGNPTQFLEPKKILSAKCVVRGNLVSLDIQFDDRKDKIEWRQNVDHCIGVLMSESKKKFETLDLVIFSRDRVANISKSDLYIPGDRVSTESGNGGGRNSDSRESSASGKNNSGNFGNARNSENSKEFKEAALLVKEYRLKKLKKLQVEEERKKIFSEIAALEEEMKKISIDNVALQRAQAGLREQLEKSEKVLFDSADKALRFMEGVLRRDEIFLQHGLAREVDAFKEIFGSPPLSAPDLPNPGPSKYMYAKKRVDIK